MLQNILLIFFQALKNVRPIFSLQSVLKHGIGQIWPHGPMPTPVPHASNSLAIRFLTSFDILTLGDCREKLGLCSSSPSVPFAFKSWKHTLLLPHRESLSNEGCNTVCIKENSGPTQDTSVDFWDFVLRNSLVHRYKLRLPIQIYLSDILTCNILILLSS